MLLLRLRDVGNSNEIKRERCTDGQGFLEAVGKTFPGTA